jgi:hypothetical protein
MSVWTRDRHCSGTLVARTRNPMKTLTAFQSVGTWWVYWALVLFKNNSPYWNWKGNHIVQLKGKPNNEVALNHNHRKYTLWMNSGVSSDEGPLWDWVLLAPLRMTVVVGRSGAVSLDSIGLSIVVPCYLDNLTVKKAVAPDSSVTTQTQPSVPYCERRRQ